MHPRDTPGPDGMEADFTDCGESGLVILDQRARVAYMSARARQILLRAAPASPSMDRGQGSEVLQIPPEILNVFSSLLLISQGREAGPPVARHDGPSGRFVFRAQWLEPMGASTHAFVGVTVQQQEPLVVVMMRNMHAAGLSEKQTRLCLLMQQNQSFKGIAAQLRISVATAKDYADRVYRKLDVHSREEALHKLSR